MKPTNTTRLTLWQSRLVQDIAVWICALVAAIVMSIVW